MYGLIYRPAQRRTSRNKSNSWKNWSARVLHTPRKAPSTLTCRSTRNTESFPEENRKSLRRARVWKLILKKKSFRLCALEKSGIRTHHAVEKSVGRRLPGWHLECSAMSMKYLGQTLDIHGGGLENIFPHHECEIAQSEAANKQAFVRYWIHNNMVTVNGQKMGKSLGNFVTLKDAFKNITLRPYGFLSLPHTIAAPWISAMKRWTQQIRG